MSKPVMSSFWLRRARVFSGLTSTITNRLASPATQNLHKSQSFEVGTFSGRVFHCGGKRETYCAQLSFGKMVFPPPLSASIRPIEPQKGVSFITPPFARHSGNSFTSKGPTKHDADDDASTASDGKNSKVSSSDGGNSSVSKRSAGTEALINWGDNENIPSGFKTKLIEEIEQDGLELGVFRFDTQQNAQNFVAMLWYGQRTFETDYWAGRAYREAEKILLKPIPPIPTKVEVANSIIDWLKNTILEPVTIGVHPTIMSDSDLSMNYVGRSVTTDAVDQLFTDRFSKNKTVADRVAKQKHYIGALGSGRGVGKTRTQVELTKYLGQKVKDNPNTYGWYAPVIITYNTGNFPRGEEYGDDTSSTKNFFGSHVLFYALQKKQSTEPIKENFDIFVQDIRKEEWGQYVDLETVFLVFRKIMNEECAVTAEAFRPGVIYLGIDEYSLLLEDRGTKSEEQRTPLKRMITEIRDLMKNTDRSLFVFPMLSGTDVTPLEILLRNTKQYHLPIPIRLLDMSHVLDVVRTTEAREQWPVGWQSNALLRTLNDYGRHPRSLERLLEAANKQLKGATHRQARLLDLSHAVSVVTGEFVAGIDDNEQKRRVLADGICNREVKRTDPITPNSSVTYGELEEHRRLYLGSDGNRLFVELTHPMVQSLSNAFNDEALPPALTKLLRDVRNRVIYWSTFEDIIAHHDAVREMMFARFFDSQMTLKELYPGGIGKPHVLDRTIVLSKNVEVDTCQKQVQGEPGVRGKTRTIARSKMTKYVLKNAVSAGFDVFKDRLLSSGEVARIIFQPKYLMEKRVLKTTDVLREHTKVDKALKGSVFQNRFILFIFATQVADDVRNMKLPDNVIIIDQAGLSTFLGSAFSYNVLGHLEGHGLAFVNGEDELTLRSFCGIGEELAQAIIDNRPYRNWSELKSAVPGIKKNVQPYLSFE